MNDQNNESVTSLLTSMTEDLPSQKEKNQPAANEEQEVAAVKPPSNQPPAKPVSPPPAQAPAAAEPVTHTLFSEPLNMDTPDVLKPKTPAPSSNKPKAFSEMTPEEKQAAAQADPDIDIDLSKAGDGPKQSILNLREQREVARARAAELEKELATTKAALEGRPTDDIIEQIRQQNKILQNELGYFKVESTPVFKTQVTDERDAITKTLKLVGNQYNVQGETIDKFMSMNGRDRIEYLKTQSPEFFDRILPHIAAMDKIDAKELELRNDHPKVMEESRKNQDLMTQQQIKDQQDNINKMVRDAMSFAESSKVPFFVEIEGDEGHNEIVKALKDDAMGLFHQPDPAKIAKYATLGVSVPAYHTRVNQLITQVETLEATIAQLKGLKPGQRGSAGPSGQAPAKGEKLGGIAGFVDSVTPEGT